jgi:peptidoglycan/LPS O-acetylase OafA/YrhL
MPESPISSKPAPAVAGRYHFIDSIRGLAALLVLVQHTGESMLTAASSHWQSALILYCDTRLDVGRVAVAAFFMVSGYVVPFSLKGPRQDGVERFVVSRFFRLYPMYWLSLAVALGIGLFIAAPAQGFWTVAANVTMLQQFAGIHNVIGVYWTLQIELIFYGLCAVLFATGFLHRRSTLIAANIFFLVVSLGLAEVRHVTLRKLPLALPMALTLMFLGTLWKRAQLDGDLTARRAASLLTAAFLIALPVISLLAYNHNYGQQEHWYQYTNGYGLAVLLFLALTTFARIQQRWVVWLGTVSYGLYLLHEPVTDLYVAKVLPHLSPSTSPLLQTMLVAAVTIALCGVLHRFVEQPSIALGARISQRLRLRRLARNGVPLPADSSPVAGAER